MKKTIALSLIALTLTLSLFACKDEPPADDPKPQSATITFGANLSTNVTGHMTNAQWDNVIGKLTTALNAAANDDSVGDQCNTLFGLAGVNIDLLKTTEFNYYKLDLDAAKFIFNVDYVIEATEADLSAKIVIMIKAAFGNGDLQQ